MGWLIDTSVWIAVERQAVALADVHAITRQEKLYVSPVNVAEMQIGIALLPDGNQKLRALAMLRLVQRKPQLRITTETGVVFGTLAATLKQAGRSGDFRINDLWLAAQAMQRDFRLLTANPKDFADIPGLKMAALLSP